MPFYSQVPRNIQLSPGQFVKVNAVGDGFEATQIVTGSSATAASIGLGNVDNTSDLNKPISNATQSALNLKENLASKGAISGYAPLDVVQKVPTVNLGGSGADNTKFLRGDQTWVVPSGGVATPLVMYNLSQVNPMGGAMTTLTATNHTATVARIFEFELAASLTLAAVYIRTNAVLSNCLRLGIYNSAGTQVWASGVLSTIATSWLAITSGGTPAFPISLLPGAYYFATTNNNVTSTTAAYAVSPALGGAILPRWGTVPTSAGAMPASITPASITKTVGGWMCYVLLSSVTA